jgi:hypothetical protein
MRVSPSFHDALVYERTSPHLYALVTTASGYTTSAPQAEKWNGDGGKSPLVRSPTGSIWSLDHWLQDGDSAFWVELVF